MNPRKEGKGIIAASTVAVCPICLERVDGPSSSRFSLVAYCPVKKMSGRGARGPFYHSLDGHRFAVRKRNEIALRTPPPSYLRRLLRALRGAVYGLARGARFGWHK